MPSIFEEFSQTVKDFSQKAAIIHLRNKETPDVPCDISYSELYNQVVRLGNLLDSKGIKEFDRVAILLENQPEWPVTFLAVQYIQAVVVPIDIKLTSQEIRQLLVHSQARVVVSSEKIYSNIKDSLEGLKSLDVMLIDSPEFNKELDSISREIIKDRNTPPPDKVAAMFYTSGTTDLPKAVLLSQQNLLSNVKSVKQLNLITHGDCFISFLPLHHTYSFMVTCLVPLLIGAQISYPASINSEDLLECMRLTGVTILTGVPQFFLRFHEKISEKLKNTPLTTRTLLNSLLTFLWVLRRATGINLSKKLLSKMHQSFGKSLTFMATGGARLEPNVTRDLFKWGFTILEGYGLTETSPVVTLNSFVRPKIGSVGKAVPDVQIKIVNPNEQGIGEVAISGPNVMLGYYQLPQETEKVIKDGWFYSGDLGHIDNEGYLYLTGRKDELIVLSSGKKINPEDIERHYGQSRYVRDICVFSSKQTGFLDGVTQLMAVVFPDKEYFRQCGLVNIEEKIKWELDNLSHKLNSYKRIKGVVISKEELPRTRLGKLKRHNIEAIYSDKVSSLRRKEELSEEDLILKSSESGRKVLQYLSGRFKRQVSLDDHLELDLGLDSLGRIELLLDLQQFLNIEIPEEAMTDFFYALTIKELYLRAKPFMDKEGSAVKKEDFQWSEILKQDPPPKTKERIRLIPTALDKILAFVFLCSFKLFFRLFFFFKVKGRENLPKKGPYIVYANHTSYFDGFIVAIALPFRIELNSYFLGLSAYFLHPLIKNMVKTARFIPINSTLDLVESLKSCAYVLKNSKILCYFPEGQRAPEGKVIEFKKGIGILAKELNVPLIPMYIEGAFRAWPRFSRVPRPAKIKVIIGKQLTYSDALSGKIVKEDIFESISEGLRKELIKTGKK